MHCKHFSVLQLTFNDEVLVVTSMIALEEIQGFVPSIFNIHPRVLYLQFVPEHKRRADADVKNEMFKTIEAAL